MRRKGFLFSLAAQSAATATTAGGARASDDAADLIVRGATIHSVDPRRPSPEAFAVREGRFIEVGSLEAALRHAGSRTRVLDLSGRTVLPGLIDSHLHLMGVGLDLQHVDLTHAATLEEVVRRTLAYAATSPDAWLLGDGWDQNLWPGGAFPTHDSLSAVLPSRPVVLTRVDGHALLANAKAMQLAGIDAATKEPPGGRIVHDAAGQPTGVFIDNAMLLIERAIPAATPEQLHRAALAAIRECHRCGITAIGEARTSASHLAVLEKMGESGELDLRVYAMLGDDPELLGRWFAQGPRAGAYDDRLWVRAVKMYVDGALGSRGAALLAPYDDDAGNRGLLLAPQEHVRDVCMRALASGFQACTHAIGDRGNRVVLDAYEAALAARPTHDHRFRVEHAQVLSPQDIPRFAKLGIIPSMQATHQISDMAWAQQRLGPERVRGAYAWRSLLDTGVIIPNGTDAPVEPVNSLRTFHASIARQDEHNLPAAGWYPEQRMTRDEALKSMTIWGAHGTFRENVIGSLAVGKHADFVVMDRDWLAIAPEDVMETKILATYLGGEQVYDAATDRSAMRSRASRRGGCCGRSA